MLASWFLLCGIAWTTPVIAQAVDHCVEVESTNSVGSLLRNKCPFAVNAVWVDHGFCKSGHPCAQGFDANQKQSVPRITGPVRVAACRMEMMRASLAHLHQVNNSEKHVHNPRPLNGAEIAEAFQTMFSTVAAMISVPQQRNADRDTIPSRLCPTRLELTAQRIGL
jgi:hypothetical protein